MADQQPIPQLTFLNDQESTAVGKVAHLGPAEIERKIRQIARSKGMEASSEFIKSYVKAYSQQYLPPNPTEDFLPVAGDIVAPVAVGLLASALRDSSRSGEIIRDLNAEHSAKLFQEGELFDKIQKAGNEEETEKLLDSLDPDTILKEQTDVLEKRIREAGGDEKTIAEIREKQQKITKERDAYKETEEGLKAKDAHQKMKKELAKTLKDPKKTKEEKANALKRYASYQQGRNSNHLHNTLSKDSSLHLRKVSIFSRSVRNSLADKGKISARTAQAQRISKFEEGMPSSSTHTIQTVSFTQHPGEPPSSRPASSNNAERQTPSRSGGLLKPLAKQLLKKGLAATSEIWGPIVAGIVILFVMLVIIVIIVVILGSGDDNNQQFVLVPVTCGDQPPLDYTIDATRLASETTARFKYGLQANANGGIIIRAIDVEDKKNPIKEYEALSLAAEQQIYTNLCELFGHLQYVSYDPGIYNTFGTGVVGTMDQIENHLTIPFRWILTVSDITKPCSFEYAGSPRNIPTWHLYYNKCTPEHLRFLMAQNLSHAFILQQQHLASERIRVNNIYSSFNNSPYAAGIMLPTNDCQTSRNYGENANDQQNRDCFADMVGEYFTYPLYFDGGGSKVTPPPTTINPFADYPDGKYKDYFAFAEKYLFDEAKFYTSQQDILKWAATIDARLSKRGGVDWDQFTPVENQDYTHPEMLVDPINGNFTDPSTGKIYTVKRRGTIGSTAPKFKLRYWCTDFVIDVFNLSAGYRVLSEDLGLVVDMQRHFRDGGNTLRFINYDHDHKLLAQVSPGSAIFYILINDSLPHDAEHTGIVTKISIDSHGNGYVDTDEANNAGDKPQYHYPVENWNIKNTPYPVRGFGYLQPPTK